MLVPVNPHDIETGTVVQVLVGLCAEGHIHAEIKRAAGDGMSETITTKFDTIEQGLSTCLELVNGMHRELRG